MDRIKKTFCAAFALSVIFSVSLPLFCYGETPSSYVFHGREIDISTDFDNGWLSRVEERETNVFDCWPYEQVNYRWGWLYLPSMTRESSYDNSGFCFHFRMTGCTDKKVTLDFHVKDTLDSTLSSILYANPDFPVYSYNGDAWLRTDTKSFVTDPSDTTWTIVTVELDCTEDSVYVAFQYPYSTTYIDRLVERIGHSPFISIETIGHSTEGRAIRQITLTEPSIPQRRKLTVWIMGLQHTSELGAGFGLQSMIDFLLSDEPAARDARELYTFKFIPIVNLDAVDEGGGRNHSTGQNLNRLWELESSIPEVDSIKRAMESWIDQGNRIDLFLDIHGFSAPNGQWTILMPEEAYSSTLEDKYKTFVGIMQSHFPHAPVGLKSIPGLSCNAGLRLYGAVSFCIDGYIYDWSDKKTSLSSYYETGDRIWPLEDVRASGETYVNSLVEYARWKQSDVGSPEVIPCLLFPNYPNPFNAETTISCRVLAPCPVRIDIRNITGQTVATILDGYLEPGTHSVVWNGRDSMGRDLHSGAYFVRMHVGGDTITRKMMLVK